MEPCLLRKLFASFFFSFNCLYSTSFLNGLFNLGSVVEWLKHRAYDQHDLDSKPFRAILLCPWERHFTAHSPAWWSWQAVLN